VFREGDMDSTSATPSQNRAMWASNYAVVIDYWWEVVNSQWWLEVASGVSVEAVMSCLHA